MESVRAQAVADNVAWCDLVCRSLGVGTSRSDAMWWCTDDAPPLYPDIITATPDVPLEQLLSLLEERPRCSVKDSFAALDLSGEGFEVLFDATWITRPAGVPEGDDPSWKALSDEADLTAWEAAWLTAGGAAGSMSPLLLLDEPVVFLAEVVDERVIAGAIAHRGAGVLGISNVFSVAADQAGVRAGVWPRAAAAVSWLAPEQRVVGYELGAALDAVLAVGFEAIGSLRVWRRD